MADSPVRAVGMCQRHQRLSRPVTWSTVPESWVFTTQSGVEWGAMWLCDECAAKAKFLRSVDLADAPSTVEILKIDCREYPSGRIADLAATVAMMRDVARAGHSLGDDITLSDVVCLLTYLAAELNRQGR